MDLCDKTVEPVGGDFGDRLKRISPEFLMNRNYESNNPFELRIVKGNQLGDKIQEALNTLGFDVKRDYLLLTNYNSSGIPQEIAVARCVKEEAEFREINMQFERENKNGRFHSAIFDCETGLIVAAWLFSINRKEIADATATNDFLQTVFNTLFEEAEQKQNKFDERERKLDELRARMEEENMKLKPLLDEYIKKIKADHDNCVHVIFPADINE